MAQFNVFSFLAKNAVHSKASVKAFGATVKVNGIPTVISDEGVEAFLADGSHSTARTDDGTPLYEVSAKGKTETGKVVSASCTLSPHATVFLYRGEDVPASVGKGKRGGKATGTAATAEHAAEVSTNGSVAP
jgi:hypothetical protein